jgi:hypothetical protein
LTYAWERGIVHRDIKPGNIMIERDGRIRLMDMGLAKDVRDAAATVTQAGGVLGSPAYAAPEQLSGQVEVDTRADIYAIGTTLFHLACGRPAFVGETTGVVAAKNLAEPIPDPRELNPALSEPFCALLRKLTEKDPDRRYQVPEEVVEAINKVAAGEMPEPPLPQLRWKRRHFFIVPVFEGKYRRVFQVAMVLAVIFSACSAWFLYRKVVSTRPETDGDERTLPMDQFPRLGNVKITSIFNGKLYALGGIRLRIEHDFSSSDQFSDWGDTGEAPGELLCAGRGKILNARFGGQGLKIECDAILVEGQTAGITIADPDDPAGLRISFSGSAGKGWSLEASGADQPVSSGKSKLELHKKQRISLEVREDRAVGRFGNDSLELAIRPKASVAVRLHAGPKGLAVFDNVKVEGTIDKAWAEGELMRERNRRWVSEAIEYYGSVGDFALSVPSGGSVRLPAGFVGFPEWTVEMFVLVSKCSVGGTRPFPTLFLCQLPSGESDKVFIDPGTCRVEVRLGRTSPSLPAFQSLTPLTRGRWYHVAMTVDDKSVRLFLDGVLDSARSLAGHGPDATDCTFVGIGDPSRKMDYPEIVVDDFRVSRKAVYADDTFNPRPPRKSEPNTWLLLDFVKGEGTAASSSTPERLTAEISNGDWVPADQPSSRARQMRNSLVPYERTGRPVEFPADDKWCETGIYVRKGAELSLKVLIYRYQARPENGAEGEAASAQQAKPEVLGMIHPGQSSPFGLGEETTVKATGPGVLRLKCDGSKAGVGALIAHVKVSEP